MSTLFESVGYTAVLVRYFRVPSHREGLEVLAEATTQSSEADYMAFEWDQISMGNRAEFRLRRSWALSPQAESDPTGWRFIDRPPPLWDIKTQAWLEVLSWRQIEALYGPPADRHRADLCKWLHGRKYPVSVGAHGGAGDAGGRARRIIADLDWARGRLPSGLTEHEIEKQMARLLGWSPPSEIREGAA